MPSFTKELRHHRLDLNPDQSRLQADDVLGEVASLKVTRVGVGPLPVGREGQHCAIGMGSHDVILADPLRLGPRGKLSLPSGLICWYALLVTDAIPRTRKSRGRPKGDAVSVHLRAPADLVAAIDQFIADEAPGISRPEAVRRLTVEALQKMGMLPVA